MQAAAVPRQTVFGPEYQVSFGINRFVPSIQQYGFFAATEKDQSDLQGLPLHFWMYSMMDLGFHQLRVRIHGTIARIEVLPAEFEKLLQNREQIVAEFKKYGFTYVTMDLQGYRMGSMNETLNLKG